MQSDVSTKYRSTAIERFVRNYNFISTTTSDQKQKKEERINRCVYSVCVFAQSDRTLVSEYSKNLNVSHTLFRLSGCWLGPPMRIYLS